jgi:hypothetical protein
MKTTDKPGHLPAETLIGLTHREYMDLRIFRAVVDKRPVPASVEIGYRSQYGDRAYNQALRQARHDAGLFDC